MLQRKSLGQTGWMPGLKVIGTRRLVGDGRLVKVYGDTDTAASDKLEALRKAAVANADVGWTIDSKAWDAWWQRYGWDKPRVNPDDPKWRNDKWTKGAERNFNREDIERIDPFFYEVTVPYKVADAAHTLKLRFQHASSYTGYVETVYDSANPGATSSPSMYDFTSESSLKGTTPNGRNLRFSNKHDKRSADEILAETYGDTEESFDAYTKIAGEGARWQCVRNHADKLKNRSYFYVKDNNGRFWGVTFITLWLSWDSVFNKRYNISDEEVADAIMDGAFGSDLDHVPRPGAKDYLLA